MKEGLSGDSSPSNSSVIDNTKDSSKDQIVTDLQASDVAKAASLPPESKPDKGGSKDQTVTDLQASNGAKAASLPPESKPDSDVVYFHQYDFEKTSQIPKSLIIVQDKDDVSMALVSSKDATGKKKLEFKPLEKVAYQDNGAAIELFTNKDLISAAIANFKGGFNQSNLVLDKVYVALNRPPEKIKQWIKAKQEGEKLKEKFKDNEVPYSALHNVGISRDLLTKKQLDLLKKGEPTGLIHSTLKNGDIELKNVPPYTINLERKNGNVEARLTFQKTDFDINKDKIGKNLSKDQKLEVLKTGNTYQSTYNKETGAIETNQVTWNKSTNVLQKKYVAPDKINIKEVAITHGIELSNKDVADLAMGKKVMSSNIINPETGKAEIAIVALDKKQIIKPVFSKAIELDKEKTVEHKER